MAGEVKRDGDAGGNGQRGVGGGGRDVAREDDRAARGEVVGEERPVGRGGERGGVARGAGDRGDGGLPAGEEVGVSGVGGLGRGGARVGGGGAAVPEAGLEDGGAVRAEELDEGAEGGGGGGGGGRHREGVDAARGGRDGVEDGAGRVADGADDEAVGRDDGERHGLALEGVGEVRRDGAAGNRGIDGDRGGQMEDGVGGQGGGGGDGEGAAGGLPHRRGAAVPDVRGVVRGADPGERG